MVCWLMLLIDVCCVGGLYCCADRMKEGIARVADGRIDGGRDEL